MVQKIRRCTESSITGCLPQKCRQTTQFRAMHRTAESEVQNCFFFYEVTANGPQPTPTVKS